MKLLTTYLEQFPPKYRVQGLSKTDIQKAVADSGFALHLPDNLIQVYEWSNGYPGLLSKYSLLELDVALRAGIDLREQGASVKGLLPILSDTHEDYSRSYCVQCSSTPCADGPIFSIEGEDERNRAKLAFESVYALIRTVALALKEGAIYYEDDGPRVKQRLFKKIRSKCNPNIQFMRERMDSEME